MEATGAPRGRLLDRFGLIVALQLATVNTLAVAGSRGWSSPMVLALQAVTLAAAMGASGTPHRQRLVGTASLAGSVALIMALELAAPGPVVAGAFAALMGVVIGFVMLVVARRIVRHERVMVSTVFAALTIYLCVGLLFAVAYGVGDAILGEPFLAGSVTGSAVEPVYFSFATLTTVGYGDIYAATDIARVLAVTEALIGQLYLVTVVAVLVSNIGATRPARSTRD